jgi:hypothetical protein
VKELPLALRVITMSLPEPILSLLLGLTILGLQLAILLHCSWLRLG